MVLTDSEIEWDPYGSEMATNRPYGDNDIQVNAIPEAEKRRRVSVNHERDLCLGFIFSPLVPEICYEKLINSVTINSFQHGKSTPKKGGSTMEKSKAQNRHSVIKAEKLARKMNTGLEEANQIMRATTHNGVLTSV